MRKLILVLALVLLPWLVLADTCSVKPCSLPCVATTTVTTLVPVNNRRRMFMLANRTSGVTIYVIYGAPVGQPDYSYGFPLGPGQTMDIQVQPVPNANVHTVTSQISIVTQFGSSACTYLEVVE